MVLLKNDNSLLPFRPDSRVLVTGNCAHNIGMQCGGWTLTWQGTFNENNDFPNADSIFDGIRETVTKAGGNAQLSEQGEFVERHYMANAMGRLIGTVLSGWVFQAFGLIACLWVSAAFLAMASLISLLLPIRTAQDESSVN